MSEPDDEAEVLHVTPVFIGPMERTGAGAPQGRLRIAANSNVLSKDQVAWLRNRNDAFWSSLPPTVRDAEELIVWRVIDEKNEKWSVISDAAMASVIGRWSEKALPGVDETRTVPVNWWVDELPAEAFGLFSEGWFPTPD